MRARLIVFSSDPGGASCLIPVLKDLPESWALKVFAGRDAREAFANAGFDPVATEPDSIDEMLEGRVTAVLTSASSLPERDMTEKRLWRRAAERDVPSLAVLDQWQCYVARFSGPQGREPLGYLPTAIAVMDEQARTEMIREGFPEDRLVVTGQPALGVVRERVVSLKAADSTPGARVTWFSQPLRALFGRDLGFDEHDMLGIVRTAMGMLGEGRPRLVCKLHPRERREDFPPDEADFEVVAGDRDNDALLAASDVVLGMSTVMLVHAVLAGIPTLSVSPDTGDARNRCHPVEMGVVARLATPDAVAEHLQGLLNDPECRRAAVARLASFPSHEGAVDAVLALLSRLVA
ncbi:MAG: hypothetical protein VKO64_11725 [Candidatus Sericytochromatia bacterium]|nr:hypothetical protein [Candidatus Sericytochromatia bacterium]